MLTMKQTIAQSYHAHSTGLKEYREGNYVLNNTQEDKSEKQYCYKPYRTLHNY